MIICFNEKNEKLQTIFAMQSIAKYLQTMAVYAVSGEQLVLRRLCRPAVSAFLTRQHFIQNNLYEDRSHISPFMKTDLTSHIGLICLSHFNWLHPPIHKL